MTGKMKIKGAIPMAMKLKQIFRKTTQTDGHHGDSRPVH